MQQIHSFERMFLSGHYHSHNLIEKKKTEEIELIIHSLSVLGREIHSVRRKTTMLPSIPKVSLHEKPVTPFLQPLQVISFVE